LKFKSRFLGLKKSSYITLQKLDAILSERAARSLRALDVPRPFIEQIHHMLNLCDLSIRQWNKIAPTVQFDTSLLNEQLIKRMVYAVRYIGFGPAALLKKLIRHHRDGTRQPRVTFQIEMDQDGELITWVFNNHESFYHDMLFLIVLFLQRGAVVSKISKKSARDFAAAMKMLIAKYNIRADDEGQRRRRIEPLGPEVITLPRIAACLPQLTTNLYANGFGRAIANFSEFGNVPSAIFSPMFASVVRKTYMVNGVKYNIHPQLMLVAILVDNVLHMRDKVTSLDAIWTHYLAAYQSTVMLDVARVEQCNEFGVCEDGHFVNEITDLRDHCLRRIRELRPHDRIDDFLREMSDI